MLRQLDSTLWVNDVKFNLMGINFGNRMTCIRLSDNSMWLHSPTRFDKSTYEKIEHLGEIKHLITPSLMHNLFVMDWKKQQPNAQIMAPAHVKKVTADIHLDAQTIEIFNQLFDGEISCIPINGLPLLQEYAFIHHSSKSLILTDLAFNFGNKSSGWAKLFLTLYGAHNKFGPTITIRASIKDKAAFRHSIQEIVAKDFDRIIVSHGDIITHNGNEIFKQAFKKYL